MSLKINRLQLAAFAILSIVIHIGLIGVSAHCLGDPRHFTKHMAATVANEAESPSGIKSPPCSPTLAGPVLAQAPRAAQKGPGGILEQTGKSVKGLYRYRNNAPPRKLEHSSHPLFPYPGVPLYKLKVTYLI